MTIPEPAITAAVEAIRRATLKVPCPEDDEIARAVLEAAAPHFHAECEALIADLRTQLTEARQAELDLLEMP
jgi:hypothetical protein